MKKIFLINYVVLGILLGGCSSVNSVKSGHDWLAPLENVWKVQSPQKSYSFQRVAQPTRNRYDTLRFELRKDEVFKGLKSPTFRLEVAT